MKRHQQTRRRNTCLSAGVMAAVSLFAGALLAGETSTPLALTISRNQAAPTALKFGADELRVTGAGGFTLYDATAKRDVPLGSGSVTRDEMAGQTFVAEGDGLRLRAVFRAMANGVNVTGEIENENGGERGLIVSYRIPVWSKTARFASALDETRPLDGKFEENAYPIATMADDRRAVAMAIPPTAPCVFGLAAEDGGLAIRFYLGVSPKPRRFPNRASFAFLIYAVDPGEAFRAALARYYAAFPEYYTPRLKRDGLWMFQMGDRIPANIEQYGFDEIEPAAPTFAAAWARNRKHGIPTFPYTIVGQREIKFLPELPKTYAAAAEVLRLWQPKARELSKEDVSAEMAARLKDEIETSACTTRDGRYAMIARTTPWGGHSVTFKTNPNPDLFAEEHRHSVGADTLEVVDGWLRDNPGFAGIYVDSLGANWPATLNYRPDHFVYARYPLTLDASGRVALHNDLSHYEFLETLRARLRTGGRLLFGNGVYAYRSRSEPAQRVELQTFDNQLNEFTAGAAPPEHYRPGTRLGRFFDAALLDVAGSEAGVNATVSRCQDVRVFMGPKHYAFLNYHWEDAAKVDEYFNKALAYSIFATCSRNFMTGVEYENHPNGYLRDKKLIDWFVPLARMLSRAGWQPVRHAMVRKGQLVLERFGAGDTVYYAVYNDLGQPQSATIELQPESLGVRADRLQIAEVARETKLIVTGPVITLEVPAKKTCILRVSRAPVR
jgi:hypothetical protein